MSFRGLACGAALLVLAAADQAEAAWNNAFQVTCFRCRNRASNYYYPTTPIIARSAPVFAAAPPTAGPCCHTSYVQRSYYQPVTTYKTEMIPVTTNRTSYFYEPVCSLRQSCYVDPCTGASVQVSQPVTSYRLRSQCNAVTSYVQRCVPVQSFRIAYRLEPVTVCPPPCPDPCAPGAIGGVPQVGEFQTPLDGNRLPATNVPMAPPQADEYQTPGTQANPGSLRKPFRVDKIASRTNGARVSGQVVTNNYVTPMRGAKVLFVNTASSTKLDASADATGRFAVNLPQGGWKIYLSRRDGGLEYHSNIDIQPSQDRQVMVVSR